MQNVAGAAKASQEPLLDIQDLTLSFRGEKGRWVQVLKEVSLQVRPREILGVVGESGSGKSMTALSTLRLVPPRDSGLGGRIMFDGKDLAAASEHQMQRIRGRDISMIFQEPMSALDPVFTVGHQITETLQRHFKMSASEAHEKAIKALDSVGIASPRHVVGLYPTSLSGGMRQRVMIAMALACEPKLLIADEPTTALDVTIQAQILDLIKTRQREDGMSVLFITHDMGVVAEVADRTAVMYQGEIVELGNTADIFANPKHPYTRSLLAAVPHLGSMQSARRPMRFPVVDRSTGLSDTPVETSDTVAKGAPVLEVKNLTTRFNVRGGLFSRVVSRVHAVENVSFSVQAGETLAIVGESGCGKSTTGRSVMRLTEPMNGSVLLNGEDLTKLSRAELNERRKNIQMVFQDPFSSLNPRMTVGDLIAEPLLVNKLADRKTARAKTLDLLEQVGLLPEMERRYPHEFSGGQRQRICIARALSMEPNVIIADESVSALDVSVKAQVINLMLDLQERMKLAYLFISHDMAVVERVSHRVAVMYLGEIVEIGPRKAIFDNPQHPYTRRLLAAVPIPDPARRFQRRFISDDEIKSPIRPIDYTPPVREYREVSPGHSVMIWGPEWDAVEAKRAALPEPELAAQ